MSLTHRQLRAFIDAMCPACVGVAVVADDPYRTPWNMLLADAAEAGVTPNARPIRCPECQGTGQRHNPESIR